jgi:hypothetical protein
MQDISHAVLSDPKGGIYNDGTVHGKLLQQINQGQMGNNGEGDNAVDNLMTDGSLKCVGDDAAAAVHNTMAKNPSPLAIANGTHLVIAEDGKIHLHPNPQEERASWLWHVYPMSKIPSSRPLARREFVNGSAPHIQRWQHSQNGIAIARSSGRGWEW